MRVCRLCTAEMGKPPQLWSEEEDNVIAPRVPIVQATKTPIAVEEDCELGSRIERLRSAVMPTVDDAALAQRVQHIVPGQVHPLPSTAVAGVAENANAEDLLKQAEDELSLEAKVAQESIDVDQMLMARLARLRSGGNSSGGTADEQRLAKDADSEGEETAIARLLEEVTESVRLDGCTHCSMNDSTGAYEESGEDAILKARLSRLGPMDEALASLPSKHANLSSSSSASSLESEAQGVLQRLAVEKQLAHVPTVPGTTTTTTARAMGELEWCCVCNEDATVRCLNCDGDLFCRRCWTEGHPKSDLEMARHRLIDWP